MASIGAKQYVFPTPGQHVVKLNGIFVLDPNPRSPDTSLQIRCMQVLILFSKAVL